MAYELYLEHGPNPDIIGAGYWDEPIEDEQELEIICDTLTEARQAMVAWRNRNHLGGGNLVRADLYEGVKPVGRFSYNGRLWTPGTWSDCTEIKID